MTLQKKFWAIFVLLFAAAGCGDSGADNSDSDKPKDSDADSSGDSETETVPERPQYTPSTDSEDTEADTQEPLTCFMTEDCGSSIPFERIKCPYPLTPDMDGNLEDDAWQSASWEFMDHETGNANAEDDDDASMEFACVANSEFIYIAYRIHDDVVYSGDVSSCDVWGDDSVEFYIDACYGRAAVYDGDEAQIAVGAENIGITDPGEVIIGGCTGPFQGPDTGSISYSVTMDGGWMGELAIPLHTEDGWDITLEDGQVIGFNAHYNDDDDGGDRDSKLIWSLNDQLTDASWEDPTKFGELQFCNIGGSTDADGGVEDGGVEDGGVNQPVDAGPDQPADGGTK